MRAQSFLLVASCMLLTLTQAGDPKSNPSPKPNPNNPPNPHPNTPTPGAPSSPVGKASFTNNQRLLFDVDGNQIDAYGSKINYFNGTYYLYGNSFSQTGVGLGIKSYSSNDLTTWANNGYLFNPNTPNPCSASGGLYCSRPHIIYNQKTQKYVLWSNAGSNGYIIATSSSPSKDFVFASTPAAIDPKFTGLQPADFAVEDLGNGEAYLVFSALNFRYSGNGNLWPPLVQTLHVALLTDDYTNTTLTSYNVTSAAMDFVDQETESPDLFKRNGVYYVVASNTCGYCNGTLGIVYRSTSIQGPWTRQIISGDSCQGQVEGVLPLTSPNTNGTTYLWHSTSVPGGVRTGFSGHIFQPLQFADDGSVANLDCKNTAFPVEFTPGTGPTPTGAQISPNKTTVGTPPTAAYSPVCDSDQFTLYQTWVQPVSGTINGLSINIARSVQTVPLTISVFKFSNLTDLVSFGYKYESIGTSDVNTTRLSYTFDTTFVPLSAEVKVGDSLGFSLVGPDFAPYCHLEYDVGGKGEIGNVLFQQGMGQVSFRGVMGKSSPVYERVGKSVKFFVSMK